MYFLLHASGLCFLRLLLAFLVSSSGVFVASSVLYPGCPWFARERAARSDSQEFPFAPLLWFLCFLCWRHVVSQPAAFLTHQLAFDWPILAHIGKPRLGFSAADLALSPPAFLTRAFEGDVDGCVRVARLAKAERAPDACRPHGGMHGGQEEDDQMIEVMF